MAEQGIQKREQHPLLAVLDDRSEFIQALCPEHLPFDKIKRLFALAMMQNPGIAACSPKSVVEAVTKCARLGLDPSMRNMAFFIPYGQDLTLQVGYAGLMELARRTGRINRYKVRAVYDGDGFQVVDGDVDEVHHTPSMDADRTKRPTHYYAIAFMEDGNKCVKWMSAAEVEYVRSKFSSDRSPAWKSSYVEMGLKTVARALVKWMPMSAELAESLADDPDFDLNKPDPRAAEIAGVVATDRGLPEPERESPDEYKVASNGGDVRGVAAPHNPKDPDGLGQDLPF